MVGHPLRGALVVALLAACGGASTPPPRVAAPVAPADGAIVERAPCPAHPDEASFRAAVVAYHQEDMLKAGLAAELAAEPFEEIYPYAENERLRAASAAGRCERIVYLSGGLRVVGFILRPEGAGPHPVLLWVRGGSADFGRIEEVTLLNLMWFAERGFVVLATQYRGNDGGEGKDEMAGADVADVMALLPIGRALPDADADRLFVIGGSRGAMQALVALRAGLHPRAMVLRGGMYDLEAVVKDRPDMAARMADLMPDWGTDGAAAIQRRSAIRWAGELPKVPMLLVHGAEDWRIRVADARAFAAELARAGIPHELVVYDRDEHQLAFHRAEWLNAAVAWFERHGASGR